MEADHLDMAFMALADPTRRALHRCRLAQGEATAIELEEPFKLSLPGVSKHLKVLQCAGLVTQGRKAQWRPCRLEAAPLKDVADWVEHYRRFWDEIFGPAKERDKVVTEYGAIEDGYQTLARLAEHLVTSGKR